MTGLTPAEAHIMALWDAGCSTGQIARSLGYAKTQVARVVSNYRDNDEYGRACAAIARGSRQLAIAIAQAKAQVIIDPAELPKLQGPPVPLPSLTPDRQRHIFIKAGH